MQSEIASVLVKAVPAYPTLPVYEKGVLHSSLLSYLFRMSNARDFRRDLREIDKEAKPKNALKALLSNGIVLGNIKLFAYASADITGLPGKFYEINSRDEDIVVSQLENNKKFRRFLNGFIRQGYHPLSLAQLRKLIDDVIRDRDLHTFTMKFIHRKMKFIIQTTGIKPQDVQNDLYSWATYSIYRAYPRIDSYQHAINIAKQTIHNRGINFIMEHTAVSRQRLMKNSDGTFSSTNVPIQSLVTTTGNGQPISVCNHLVVDMAGKSALDKDIQEIQDLIDLKISFRTFYDALPLDLKRLMKLWSGVYDKGFSKYLGISNDEWFEQIERDEYLTNAVEYLQIPIQLAHHFHAALRLHFDAYRKDRKVA